MSKSPTRVPQLLDVLEDFYGVQAPCWPVEPYEFIVWWHCGYPASDKACAKGWAALAQQVGIQPQQLLSATPKQLAAALTAGGMVPELRALRLKEIAMRVQHECGGDLREALVGPVARVRKMLKGFPNIADPGADRILLFGGLTPVAAVPSNHPSVLVRILHGKERENYGVNYRQAQQDIEAEVPTTFDARTRAYLLLKQHGQEICKRANPKCEQCPVSKQCAYFKGSMRGRGA